MQSFKENELVYTDYGYGKVVKPLPKDIEKTSSLPQELPDGAEGDATQKANREERKENVQIKEAEPISNIVHVKLNWGGDVYLEEKYLSKKIKLSIKTFYGSRKKINLEIDITSTVQQLKDLLLASHLDHAKTLYNLRLIYSMGTLQELSVPNLTLEQLRLPNNANLTLLVQTSFTWDANLKASGIKLQNNNLTAGKNPEVDYQTVLGSLMFSSGRHYWEIKVDNFNDEEDLFIGIARKETNLYARPIDTNMFWGYMCLCGKKFGPDGVFADYGYQAKKGDTIGVLLEYKSGLASLSFYRNATRCGVAFTNLPGSFYPAVCMNYGDVQVTLDPKAPMPIS